MDQKHYPSLDFLRAISILLVILHHLPIPLPEAINWLRIRGDLGVELFFGISGFLVTQSLVMSSAKGNKSLAQIAKDFFIRRGTRIFPSFYLVFFSILLLSKFQASLAEKIHGMGNVLWSVPFYFYNYAKIIGQVNAPGTINILWSLCFEEQFYIILLMSYFIFRKKWSQALIGLSILSIIARLVSVTFWPHFYLPSVLQFWTHLRLDAILWGCLIWIHRERINHWNQTYPSICWINFLIMLSCIQIHGSGNPQVLAINYIFLSLSVAHFIFHVATKWQHYFSIPLIQRIGVVSYEIYLLHEIVVGVLVKFNFKETPLVFAAATFLISILSAFALHYSFSKPVQLYLRRKLL